MGEYDVSFEETKDLLENGNYKEAIVKLTEKYKSAKKAQVNPLQFKFGKRYRSWALPPTIDQLYEIRNIVGDRKI